MVHYRAIKHRVQSTDCEVLIGPLLNLEHPLPVDGPPENGGQGAPLNAETE